MYSHSDCCVDTLPVSLLSSSSNCMPSGVITTPSLLIARSASNSVDFSFGLALRGYLPQGVGEPKRSFNLFQLIMPLRLKNTGQYNCRPRPVP